MAVKDLKEGILMKEDMAVKGLKEGMPMKGLIIEGNMEMKDILMIKGILTEAIILREKDSRIKNQLL